MHVLDHQPYAWYLLEDVNQLFLDCHCSHSFFDYSVLIALTAAEDAHYRARGRVYLDELAHAVHNSAPAARGSKSPYGPRNLTVQKSPHADRAYEAIMAWRASQPPAG